MSMIRKNYTLYTVIKGYLKTSVKSEDIFCLKLYLRKVVTGIRVKGNVGEVEMDEENNPC